MNTQVQMHLQAGQAFTPPSRHDGPVILAEGELLAQAPADWLGGTVVVPPPVRLVAPAVVDPSSSFVAVRASTLVVPQPVPLLTLPRWLVAAARRTQRRFAT
jgi:hypothetical protein